MVLNIDRDGNLHFTRLLENYSTAREWRHKR
jgi:hypothetical protein